MAVRAGAPSELPELPTDAGLTWRPLAPDDVPAWHALAVIVEDHDDAIERSSAEEFAELFKGDWRDATRDTVGGFAANGELRAYARAELNPVTEGTLTPTLFGAVHPDIRRRGIGRALATWAIARARQQLAATDSTLPARIRIFADEHQAGARVVAEQAGFTAVRWYVCMRRSLSTELPDVQLAPEIRIEPYSAERDDEVRITHNESFAVDHWGSNPIDAQAWALTVIESAGFRADWSFIAVDTTTNHVVGYTIAGAYEQDWKPQGFTEGWTDLLGVRREYRGRGIAAALLRASMRAYAASGIEYAGLDVDTENPTGALGLYTRLGYVPDRGSVLYAKDV